MQPPLSRRALLGAAAGSFLAADSFLYGKDATGENAQQLTEPQRTVPYAQDCDVIVCGGGPAGIAAAISAARAGARVRLFECHGCLGGVWTSGMLSYVIDAGKAGLNRELFRRLDQMEAQFVDHRKQDNSNYVYDVEAMKYLLENLFAEEQITYQLHTRVAAVQKDSTGRMTAILTESKSGRQAWGAPVFIDATGDGDVGALAGCEWQFGQDKNCPCQPMSLMGIIAADPAVLEEFDNAGSSDAKNRLLAEMAKAGVEPSYAKPTLWNFGQGVAAVMINHEYGVEPFDAAQVTEATVRARKELYDICTALRKLGGGWKGTRLVTTAEQIGVRDGRRIRGRYMVSAEDLVAGIRHEDAVTRSTFSVDVHAPTREENRKSAYSTQGIKARPFDIPYRALIAADVDGLLLAGRCISGDFIAHASYRVTGNAVGMGEAAGVAAAVSAAQKRLPHELAWAEIAPELERVRGIADQKARV